MADELAHLASLLEERPREPWHIDPKDTDKAAEETRQSAFLRHCKRHAPGITVWATPNAGKRTQWEIDKAKREGFRTGALDLNIFWRGGCAIVEFKAGKTMPSEAQMDILDALHRAGHNTGVFRAASSLIEWLRALGAPIGEVL